MRKVGIMGLAIVFISIAALCINTEFRIIRLIGYSCIILSFFIFASQLIASGKVRVNTGLLIAFLPVILFYSIGFVRNITLPAVEDWGLLVLSIMMVLSASNYVEEIVQFQKKYIGKWILFFIIITLISTRFDWAYNPFDNGLRGFYSTTTFLGIFCVLLIQICLLNFQRDKGKSWLLFIFPLAVFVYMTKVRTAYVGTLLVIITYLFSKIKFHKTKLSQNKKLIKVFRYITYIVITLITVVYPIIDSFGFFDSFSLFVYQYTGKILMSGRQNLWALAFDYVKKEPIFGYGLASEFVNASGVHNSYLAVLLQTGFAGLIGVFITINSLLKRIETKDNSICNQIVLYSCINLIMSLAEVMLLQGQIILQTVIWIIMAIGLGYGEKNREEVLS